MKDININRIEITPGMLIAEFSVSGIITTFMISMDFFENREIIEKTKDLDEVIKSAVKKYMNEDLFR